MMLTLEVSKMNLWSIAYVSDSVVERELSRPLFYLLQYMLV
jgi:hypothetical protein